MQEEEEEMSIQVPNFPSQSCKTIILTSVYDFVDDYIRIFDF